MARSLLALVAAGLAAAATSASASATTLVLNDGTPRPAPYQSWIDRAHAPLPHGAITLRLGTCPGAPGWAGGCADLDAQEIYLTSLARSPDRLLHEVGHFFDGQAMTPRHRARFTRLIGRRGPWTAAAHTDPPSEQFAEAYSLCARHTRLAGWYFGMYAYSPSPTMHAAACALIRAAARNATAKAKAKAVSYGPAGSGAG